MEKAVGLPREFREKPSTLSREFLRYIAPVTYLIRNSSPLHCNKPVSLKFVTHQRAGISRVRG